MAAEQAPGAAPMPAKSRLAQEVADASVSATSSSLDAAFGDEAPQPVALSAATTGDLDTGSMPPADGAAGGRAATRGRNNGGQQLEDPGFDDEVSLKEAEGSEMSAFDLPTEADPEGAAALGALGYGGEAGDQGLGGLISSGSSAGPAATKGEAGGGAVSADEDLLLRGGASRSEEKQKAAELAQSMRKDRAPAAPAAAAAPLREEVAEAEEADADDAWGADEEAYGYATTTNTGAVSNTGEMWNTGAPPRSLQDLRIDAVTSSASPSRGSLSAKYPEVAAADALASEALGNGDTNGAVRALEGLMKHPDANVVMDTAFAIGDLLRSDGRADVALAYVARGLGVSGGSTSQRSRLLALRGQILEQRGDQTGAKRYYQESIDAMDEEP